MAALRKPATHQRTITKTRCNHREIALSLTSLMVAWCVNYRVLVRGVPAVMSARRWHGSADKGAVLHLV